MLKSISPGDIAIFDYLSYCKHSFEFREDEWQAKSLNLNKSISINHRSMENMKFSW